MAEIIKNFLGLKIEKTDGKFITHIAEVKGAMEGYSEFLKSIPCHKDGLKIESSTIKIENSINIKSDFIQTGDKPFEWSVKGLFNKRILVKSIDFEFKEESKKCKVFATVYGILDIFNKGGSSGIKVQMKYLTNINGKLLNCWEIKLLDVEPTLSILDIKKMTSTDPKTESDAPAKVSTLDNILKSLTVNKDKFRILSYHPTNYNAYIELQVDSNKVLDLGGLIKIEQANVKAAFTSGILAILIKGTLKLSKANVNIELGLSSLEWARLSIELKKEEEPLSISDILEWIGSSLKGNTSNLLAESSNTEKLFHFAVTGIEGSFSIHNKCFDDLNILGTVTIASLKIDSKVHLLSKRISGKLREEKSVSTILTSFGLPALTLFENLKISEFFFNGSLDNYYSVSFNVDSAFSILFLELKGIKFRIDSDPVNGVKGAFICTADIGNLPFLFSYKFTKDTGASSCEMEGGLATGNKVKMADFVKNLMDCFDLETINIPESMELEKLTVSYLQHEKKITFTCAGSIEIGDKMVKASFDIAITKDEKKDDDEGTVVEVKGEVNILGYTFAVAVKNNEKQFILSLTYNNDLKKNVPLSTFIEELCGKKIPFNLTIDISQVKICYYIKKETDKDKPASKHILVQTGINTSFKKENIPLIGSQMSDIDFKISDLQLLYCSNPLTVKEVESINKSTTLKIPIRELSKGLIATGSIIVKNFKLEIDTGRKDTEPKQLSLGVYEDECSDNYLSEGKSEELPQIIWINIKKKIGSLYIGRVGLEFGDSIALALDASFALGPVTISVMELKGSRAEDGFTFGLKGAGLRIDTEKFNLSGQLLSVNNPLGYYGCAMLKVGDFSIKLLGGYTPGYILDDGKEISPSMFIYTNVEVPLGGPVFFNVKGFAGGLGLNYKLNLPKIEDLHNFILLPTPGSKAPSVKGISPQQIIDKVIPQMRESISPAPNQYWISAGIHARSLEMVDIFALATVSFGVDLVISLIGTVSMTLPKGVDKPIAYIEIVIKAAYTMSEGVLSIEGAVAPATYLLGDFCKLKGGLALYIWINPPEKSGIKKGDFCFSLGGYHPQYKVPKHYPRPALVELKFNLDSLQIQGRGYFAVVPSMFMLGLMVKATYQVANIKAWFEFTLNMIMSWSPLKYNAIATVNIGCIVQLKLFKISASASALLEIWGPEFGGKADVDLSIIKFTIYWGKARKIVPQLLTWNEFSDSFLFNQVDKKNNSQTPFSISVSEGQIDSDAENNYWIVDANNFRMHVNSLIPANTLLKSNFEDEYKSRESINVKMLGKNNVQSNLTVSLKGKNNDTNLMVDIIPQIGDATGALWQTYKEEVSIKDPSFLEDSICGVIIKPKQSNPSHIDNVPLYSLLFNKGAESNFHFGKKSVNPDYSVDCIKKDSTLTITVSNRENLANQDYILKSIAENQVKKRRNLILENLKDIGLNVYSGDECTLEKFTKETILADWPLVGLIGDNYNN